MSSIRISVVTPVYNASAFLEKAIQSALDQPETDELILVDDGSNDDSLEICRKWAEKDGRVVVLQHKGGVNKGPSATRNLGIGHASNPWIAFLDADDYYLPGRFSESAKLLEKDPGLDGVYEGITSEDIYVREGKHPGMDKMTTVRKRVEPEQLIYTMTPVGEQGHFSSDGVVIRKTILQKAGLYEEGLHIGEDILLWLKCAAIGRLAGGRIDEAVTVFTRHEENITHNIEVRYYLIEVFKRLIRWGRETGNLTRQHYDAILYKYSCIWFEHLYNTSNRLALYPRILFFLIRLVAAFPFYLKSPKLILSLKDIAALKKLYGQKSNHTLNFQ